jgi:hypothetical protein
MGWFASRRNGRCAIAYFDRTASRTTSSKARLCRAPFGLDFCPAACAGAGNRELIAGFVTGVEWVNDSVVAIVDLDDRGSMPFVVLEDRYGSGKDETLNLTRSGTRGGWEGVSR